MSKNIYSKVAGNKPHLNLFDLSYTNTFSGTFGLLYPVQCDECTPGDVWKISDYVHAELMPLMAPVMSDIQMFVHTFFVPYRLLYGVDVTTGKNLWELFISGGEEGDYDTPLPPWSPDWAASGVVGYSSRKIWDYVGLPMSRDELNNKWYPLVPKGLGVSIAPKRAYNLIYNEFYRDEFLIDEVDLDNEDLLKVSFRKDYFTSAALSQQLGISPALPVTVGDFVFKNSIDDSNVLPVYYWPDSQLRRNNQIVAVSNGLGATNVTGNEIYPFNTYPPAAARDFGMYVSGNTAEVDPTAPHELINPVGVAAHQIKATANATSFDINDLRLAFAIQRLQELNSRAGVRYVEWLQAHYNVFPRDDRLQRPEYIGGACFSVTVSPVVQTSGSQSDSGTQLTDQGNKSGIGQIDSVQKIGNYRVKEHGLIMTMCSIRPKPIYQQGVDRQWLRQVKEDYYIPELAFLSEQGIYNCELYTDGTDDDQVIFGYQAHWNEMRSKVNRNSGAVRAQLNYWTLTRQFGSRPALNQDFIEIVDSDFMHIFAVQDEDPFVISFSNLMDVYRPMPAIGVPGLVDHVYGGF